MSDTRWRLIEETFWSARALPEAERDAYLADVCEGDHALRDEVTRMLAADRAPGLLDHTPSLFLPASSDDEPLAERVGPYVLTSEIGRGGMGVVYRAYDPRLRRDVALKFLNAAAKSDPQGHTRFIAEARMASALDHPFHCPIYDIGTTDDGRLYIAMAYCGGGSLAQRLATGPLPIDEAIRIAAEVADALHHAHEAGIVHRDIKPANIAFTEGGVARVLDFGIATLGEVSGLRALHAGTPAYMAPEQARGETADRRADVWALGVVLHEMLTGQRPTADTPVDPRALRPDIPASLAHALARALEHDPDKRFATAADFRAALLAVRPKQKNGHRVRRYAVAAIAIALLIATGSLVMRRFSTSATRTEALDAHAVAVLPFRVSGDPAIAYLREGMMDLLAAKLTGEGGLRAVDPRSVHGSLPASRPGEDTNQVDAAAVARRLGAGNVLLGSVVGSPSGIVVNASLLNIDGKVLGRATAQGSHASLSDIVDRLVARLLSESAGEEPQRLAALTSTSLPALRAYLEGQAAYRRGRYGDALDEFARALDFDSTFALAGIGLALADGWVGTTHAAERGLAVAWRWRDRLTARDRALLEVSAGPDYPRPPTMTERLDAVERALRLAPDRVELWYELGDQYFHFGRVFGTNDWEARAERGFRRALELDSGFTAARQHLVQLYARQARRDELRALASDALRREPHGPAADYIRWRSRIALGEDAGTAGPLLDSLATETLGWIGMNTHDDGFAVDAGRRAIALRNARPGTREERLERMLSMHAAALNAGQPGAALLITDSLRALQDDSTFYLRLRILSSLYGDADRQAGERAVAQLTNATTSDARARRLDQCVIRLWQVQALSRAAEAGAVAPPPDATVQERICVATLSVVQGRPGQPLARHALALLEELYRSGPLAFFPGDGHVEYAPIVLARAYEASGDREGALAALRRRPYFIGWQPFLAASLREEARLATAVGDDAGAARAHQHFLALRAGPTPE